VGEIGVGCAGPAILVRTSVHCAGPAISCAHIRSPSRCVVDHRVLDAHPYSDIDESVRQISVVEVAGYGR
jgi:hypothetical protein